ncbi:DivIVA domain-containing protein [Yinghuangia seranimata]|uniref:DivIVA domain-containing protein n=1 Tax=Yinghuangia seranimata TaxID=408067 RepID=UPI00248CBF74|nr:DivIVA domain-containing protein [Yinghuangia seranimata]MDI2128942.1 DivIVA domain-containing protein [Yinghuangia seranimata]
MFWIQLVVVTGVVFVVAAVVLGAGGTLPDAYPDRPDLSWTTDRPLTVEDVDRVRFPVVLRGYRMSEVDYTLDRLSAELSARDARIMDLEYRLAGVLPAGVAAPYTPMTVQMPPPGTQAAPDTTPAQGDTPGTGDRSAGPSGGQDRTEGGQA